MTGARYQLQGILSKIINNLGDGMSRIDYGITIEYNRFISITALLDSIYFSPFRSPISITLFIENKMVVNEKGKIHYKPNYKGCQDWIINGLAIHNELNKYIGKEIKLTITEYLAENAEREFDNTYGTKES